jgi:hypothetical protein
VPRDTASRAWNEKPSIRRADANRATSHGAARRPGSQWTTPRPEYLSARPPALYSAGIAPTPPFVAEVPAQHGRVNN